jgi:hypothetical protein
MSRVPYASAPDVNALLSFVPTFTATSRPNASQVAFHLELASNDLDAELALADYSIPVATGATVAAEMLRSWTALGAAFYLAQSMPQGQDSLHARDYRIKFETILNRIRQDEIELPGATRDTALNQARYKTYTASTVADYPAFSRDYPDQ